ncbi:cAMP-binding domain of CRP or a regulatory subunit of cAMP-dependent protein kinases [Dyadobacter koreensis]|uniref:cAMP-binding domain of CRP or a regulatory subunit of cAMP-dependent protein kinases n=1 Tax=Dyadobacter koreensis TaxID=408657 RepID=A0A1H6US95_9BACT|nr:Crp/Fnr family transcriptional regulator [Dyadobacter koreensis]SEI95303.1 cAMP-binding domain of CRP or a regulatory subunit of cAMP-dependent protein kinases [Dyadobacter koreensis]
MEPGIHALKKVEEKLRTLAPISDNELDVFCKNLVFKSFEKGEFLCLEGQVENYIFFILRGATRNYFSKDGKEFTVGFHFENEFVSAYYSLITREPSPFSIEVIDPVQAFVVPQKFLISFYDQYKSGERIGRLIAEKQYIQRIRREMDLLSLTAEQRYTNLLKQNPTLVQSISVKHLSSFLGIQPESLSRIRKQYSRN